MRGDGFFDNDADIEQAEFEAAGREYSRRHRRMEAHIAAGRFAEAAAACPHGSGYPLDSIAARNSKDPRAGEAGFRCCDCGSALDADPFEGPARVTFPCEFRRT